MGPMLPHKSYEKSTNEIMWNCLDFSGCVCYNDVLTSAPQTNTNFSFLLFCPLTSYVFCRFGCVHITDIVTAVIKRPYIPHKIHSIHSVFHTDTQTMQHLDTITVFFYLPTDALLNCALPDDGDCTETCRSCFNINFNVSFKIVSKTIQLCISW
jgi:hypothetical protein